MKIKHLLLLIVALTIGITAEAQTTKSEKAGMFADANLKLSGYLQTGFSWDDNEGSSFYIMRARVSLTGNFAEEKFDYRLQVDMAGSPKICDLYLRYKPLSMVNVQLGQFKLPFSLENELYGPTTFEFIEYSYLTLYMARNNARYDGIAATGRDLGMQLYGGFVERDGYNLINYNIGVFNGAGINAKDNNKSKDFIARVIVKPMTGLSLSGSYMYSEVKHGGNNYMKAPRWSVGAIYDVRHWIARTEFAQANFGGNTTNTFYALAGHHFEKPWTVAARYEFVRDELRVLDEQRVTLGAAYKPFKFLRLQLNASYTMNDIVKRNTLGANFMATAIF